MQTSLWLYASQADLTTNFPPLHASVAGLRKTHSITSTGCSKSCSQYPRPSPDSFGASLSGSHSVLKKVMHAAWLIPSQLNLLVSSVKLGSTYILAEQGFASVWNSVVSVKTHDDSCLKNFYINPLTDYLKQKLSVQNVLHFCSWINNRETAN